MKLKYIINKLIILFVLLPATALFVAVLMMLPGEDEAPPLVIRWHKFLTKLMEKLIEWARKLSP